ncbi:MAG: MFS transporter [candidate division SR1 bacterium]|nr:MFS transporter [candidate division SR1 bacterium]
MEQNNHEHNTIIKIIKKDFFSVPISIRMVSFSLFIFLLGRGLGADTFFSVYIKTIVDNVLWISIIGAILSLGKMLFSIPVGEVDDHADLKSVLFLSKGAYVITGLLYFVAGIGKSPVFLLIAVLLNGFATATLLTTYQAFIRKHSKRNTRGTSFGLYFSASNLAYVVGALIAAVLVKYVDLPYMFLFISLFAVISFFTDKQLPRLSKEKIKAFLGRDTFIHRFFIEVFSLRAIKRAFLTMKDYSHRLYYALGFEFMFNLLNYIGFIFIPIVSVQNHLTLPEIAIVFAVMRVPYLIDFFTGNIADHTSKRKFLFFVLLFISFLYMLLGYNEGFRSIMIITFAISFGLSIMRPVISAFVSDCVDPKDEGTISGVEEFVARGGEMIGIILFGISSTIFGIQTSFILVGITIFIFALAGLVRRFGILRRKITP